MRHFKVYWKMKLIQSQAFSSLSPKVAVWFSWLPEWKCSLFPLSKWPVSNSNVISHSSLLGRKIATGSIFLVWTFVGFLLFSVPLVNQNKSRAAWHLMTFCMCLKLGKVNIFQSVTKQIHCGFKVVSPTWKVWHKYLVMMNIK